MYGDARWYMIAAPELPERGRERENRVARSIATYCLDERRNGMCSTAESVEHRHGSARHGFELNLEAQVHDGSHRRRGRRRGVKSVKARRRGRSGSRRLKLQARLA